MGLPCAKCHNETTTTAEQYEATVAAYRQWNLEMPRVICAACDVAPQLIDSAVRAFHDCVDDGLIPASMEKYRTPEPGLVAQNAEHWEWARGIVPGGWHAFLHGAEGTGKTALARFILWRCIESGYRVAEVYAEDFEYRLWQAGQEKRIDALCGVPVLLIDDVSSVRWTQRGLDMLRRVLHFRHDRQLTMLVTSNQNDRKFAEVVGAASCDAAYAQSLLRRLRPCKKIEMKGGSFRAQMEIGGAKP